MDFIGIDLHKNSSQVCVLTEDGELFERRIKTDRESFDQLLAERAPARILVESSTESEWVAQHLEALGRGDGGGSATAGRRAHGLARQHSADRGGAGGG